MKLEKCQVCNEWIERQRIAMHYWNKHKEKYSKFKDNAEVKEIESEVADEKNKHRENETKQVKTDADCGTRRNDADGRRSEGSRGEVKKETQRGVRRSGATEIVEFGHEAPHYTKCWVENDIEGETINEWC